MELEPIFRLAVLAIAGGIGWLMFILKEYIKAYLEMKFTSEGLAIAKETALMVVSTLQQSPAYEYLNPVKKKEIAIVWVSQKLEDYDLNFSEEDIDRLIEEAVLIIKEAQ